MQIKKIHANRKNMCKLHQFDERWDKLQKVTTRANTETRCKLQQRHRKCFQGTQLSDEPAVVRCSVKFHHHWRATDFSNFTNLWTTDVFLTFLAPLTRLWPNDRHKTAASVSRMFWLRFWMVGGSGDMSSIFIYTLRELELQHHHNWK